MLEIILVRVIFIKLQKKSFGQKNFWISCTGPKVPFWQFFNFGKVALLNRCMKFKKIFWPKEIFWSFMKMTLTRIISNMSQGLPNSEFRSIRVVNRDYLKKDSQDFKNSLQFGFLWISSKPGKHLMFQVLGIFFSQFLANIFANIVSIYFSYFFIILQK